MSRDRILVHADRLFTGETAHCIHDAKIVINGTSIESVGSGDADHLAREDEVARTVHVGPDKTVVPGLIDSHCHLIMPGDGSPYQQLFSQDDAWLALQSSLNAGIALSAGVTTLVDTGSRGRVLFSLREAEQSGLLSAPNLVLSGPPITRTGGHCWFLGAEADGVDDVRRTVRQLNKDGADIIKVMATGGGTERSYPYLASITQDEFSAAVEEAHAMGKKCVAHCSSIVGIDRAICAGVDIVFHCHFYEPDGTLRYDEGIAGRLVEDNIFVNPTLWVNRVHVERLQERVNDGDRTELTLNELDYRRKRYEGQERNVGKLVQAGVRLIAGSDAGWGLTKFDDVVTELECMVEIGMTASDALLSATQLAATAYGIGDSVGTLSAGKQADLVVVGGDPTQDISALRNVEQVFHKGRPVFNA